MIGDEFFWEALIDKIESSKENIGPFFGCLSIFAFDQGNFLREFACHRH